LSVYNWSACVAPDTIPNFQAEFGVPVRYASYESNEEVVLPTHNRVQPMREKRLLERVREA
jgi:hypothetical protein